MALSMKMVASELLMCGLKNLPVVGTAVEVVEAVRLRHEMLGHADRLADAESRLPRMEKGLRDLVEKEIRTALNNLSRPNINGPTLTQEIRNIQEIRAQGWEPTLFEGLLANSSHWEELNRNPQNYGRILSGPELVDRNSIPLLIDTDTTQVLELTPYAFSQLLAGQAVGAPKGQLVSAQDVWAVQQKSTPITQKRIIRMKLDGQWFGDNETWGLQGEVEVDGKNVRGRMRYTLLRCSPTAPESWKRRVGDSAVEFAEGNLKLECLTLRGYQVDDPSLLLTSDSTIVFTRDWQSFTGTTTSRSGKRIIKGTLRGSVSVEFG